jgi:hypothetical protein
MPERVEATKSNGLKFIDLMGLDAVDVSSLEIRRHPRR